jgi:hypothetical protein
MVCGLGSDAARDVGVEPRPASMNFDVVVFVDVKGWVMVVLQDTTI